MKLKSSIRPLLIVCALSLCFFYVWGCGFGSSSGGTTLNPFGPSGEGGSQPTFEQERAAINTQINSFADACNTKDVEKASSYISPSFKDQYKAMFQEKPEQMPVLAEIIKSIELKDLSEKLQNGSRYAEGEIATNGITFHVGFVKVNEQWFVERF